MRFWPICILALLLIGCFKTTDQISPDRLSPDRESKLYVLCFISPQDSVLTAKVAMSEPKIVPTVEPTLTVKTANVSISDGQRSAVLRYDSTLGYYRADAVDLFIEAGKTYELTVSMGENRRVTAQATVPASIPIQRVQIDSVLASATASVKSTLYTATIFWDSPGGVNYYRGWGKFTQTVSNEQGVLEETRVNQPAFSVDRETNAGPGRRSLSGSFSLITPTNARIRTNLVRLGLFTTDVNYYRYHATLLEEVNNPNNSFAEPGVLYSNIKDGYGVFAGYNATYIDIKP